jgi:hypothetical protein
VRRDLGTVGRLAQYVTTEADVEQAKHVLDIKTARLQKYTEQFPANVRSYSRTAHF